jgi:glycyl-tRNA synthetase
MGKYEDVVNLALRRGIFFPAAEIYKTAAAGFYDYGPFGTSIRNNILAEWRKWLRQEEFLEIDGAITLPADVFKASGHLESFNDPMTQCKKTGTIIRADKLLEEHGVKVTEGTPVEELTKLIREKKLKSPAGGELSDVRQFNLMVKADVGFGSKTACYLRPETCQSIFTAWNRVQQTNRVKLPQGISQIGKSFRNEISPRQTLLRQVEFVQAETEVFFDPAQINEIDNWDEIKNYKVNIQRVGEDKIEAVSASALANGIVSGQLIAYYLARTQQFFEKLGIPTENMRFREVSSEERAFYAKEGWDFEVKTSLGWIELVANNYRTDYDLTRHMEISGTNIQYVKDDGTKLTPHVWEISIGFDRTFYTVLEHALRQEGERTILSLKPNLAPLTCGVFPLLKNKPELIAKAQEVYKTLKDCYPCMYDESGSIGKRYARLDEVGVPFCITIDFDSLTNNDVTLRERDTGAQKRIKISDLKDTLHKLLTGTSFNEV